MLSGATLHEIVLDAAVRRLPPESIDGVTTSDATDSEGRDALRIVIRLRRNAVERVDGNAALDTLIDIRSRLEAAGEDRFPLVEYDSVEDAELSGFAES